MDRENITTAWVEGQIDSNGIALTLLTEDSNGAVVEDVTHFTFDELQDMSGEIFSLNLSESAEEALSDMRHDANIGKILQSENLSEKAEHISNEPTAQEILAYMGFIDDRHLQSEEESAFQELEVGDLVQDTNPPSWSQDDRLEVVGISDKSADEYVIEDTPSWKDEKTVFSANRWVADPDDSVIEARYLNPDGSTSKTYAFPVSRIERLD